MRRNQERSLATPFKNKSNHYAEQTKTFEAILAGLKA
ncbi:hypothetical protein RMSM_04033 [Rhodopirellula maiorica SM1]|uniref:Uncharacterized protein n=1 Tax=Rhodopirellula maiorica SM1 TaxID=1265738 RepID=M5RYM8_9BACT|nr:hypothetical protein RMSM_04033 [Rhodopirellula maiorica SM1]